MTSLQFTILALAAYRTWVLVADDDILAPFRRRLGERTVGFLTCPWCAGFWISAGWAAAFWAHEWAVWAAVPFALSAALVFAKSAVDALQAYEDSLGDD